MTRRELDKKVAADTEELRQWGARERGVVTIELTRENIEAIAEEVFKLLERRNTERIRRRRPPCGRGNSPPLCMGSAALGPRGVHVQLTGEVCMRELAACERARRNRDRKRWN